MNAPDPHPRAIRAAARRIAGRIVVFAAIAAAWGFAAGTAADLATTAIAAPPAPPAATTVPRDVADLLPPAVKRVIYVPSVPGLLAALKASRFRDFYADPAASEAIAPLRETLEKNSPELAALLSGKETGDLDFLTGGLVVAELPPAGGAKKGDKKRARYLTIFAHNDPRRAMNWLGGPAGSKNDPKGGADPAATGKASGLDYYRVAAAPPKAGKSAKKPKKSKKAERADLNFKGGKKSKHSDKSDDDKDDKKHNSLESTPGVKLAGVMRKAARDEDHIHCGPNVCIRATGDGATIRDALGRLASGGGADSLSRSDRWRGAVEAWGPIHARGTSGAAPNAAPELIIYYDLHWVNDGKPLVGEDLLGRGADAGKLGLDQLKSAAAGFRFAPEGLRFEANLLAPAPRSGVASLLFMNTPLNAGAKGAQPEILRLVPPDALGYAATSVDLRGMWLAFRDVFNEAAPGVLQLMDDGMNALQQGLDGNALDSLMKDMGGHWAMFARRPAKAGPAAAKSPETTYIFELKPGANFRATFEKWLRRTATTLNYKLDESQVHEKHYYRLAGADLTQGAAIKLDKFAKFCVTDRWLMISPRFEHMLAAFAQQAAAPGASPPSSSEGLARATALLPADRSLEVVSEPASFQTVMNDPFLGLFGGVFQGVGEAFVQIDAAPGDDVWSRHFGPVAGAVRAGPNNLFFTLLLPYAGAVGPSPEPPRTPHRSDSGGPK